MSDDPKMDFRYTKDDVEIEAYQITRASRWQQQLWPKWLTTQRLPDDTNCVYSMADNPDRLWLALPSGDEELPPLAWVCKFPDGRLGWLDALDLENYVKVVPIPPPAVHPEAGAAPLLSIVDVPAVVEAEGPLREAMTKALAFLQTDDAAEAQEVLKEALSGLVVWCNCSPAKCEELDQLSCRKHSPLVK